LGLSGAKRYLENLSGKLDINSTIGVGTTINLTFPCSANIEWFTKTISLSDISVVIVLDDDFSMLMYWQQRINETGRISKLFSKYTDALAWLSNNTEISKSAVFLVDYNLIDSTENGLIFLKKIHYNTNRYLITRHSEEYHLQQEVKNAGIWLIPKVLINEITFSF
jgi:hypothetical protein